MNNLEKLALEATIKGIRASAQEYADEATRISNQLGKDLDGETPGTENAPYFVGRRNDSALNRGKSAGMFEAARKLEHLLSDL
jgi:hypothetical protein